ncbi:protein-tyrosine phosphatase-like protein [Mycena vulgaris]|nr:protein-tyrosine phosphatase-like protein [Mycena vulgaris]
MAALGKHDLRSNHIAHLVQLLEVPWAPQEAGVPPDMDIAMYRIDLEDSKSAGPTLRKQLAPVCDYIRDALGRGENMLVHCQQGVSHHPAVVIAYLIRERGMKDDAAYKLVRERRRCIRPNTGFETVLREWETAAAER